jgi:hypothetical protein
MKVRTKLLSTALTVFAGAVLASSPLLASAQDFDAVAAIGVAGGITPPVESIVHCGANVPNCGSGSYSFGGNCAAWVSVDTGVDPAEVGTNCSITSSGTFANMVCGTGTAAGSATLSAFTSVAPPGSSEASITVSYHIQFVASVGILTVDGGGGGGIVQITPVAPGNCVTTDVGSFMVTTADVFAAA